MPPASDMVDALGALGLPQAVAAHEEKARSRPESVIHEGL